MEKFVRREGRMEAPHGVALTPDAAGHLRAALEQMELLLESRQAEAGLGRLVAMLWHLRAMRLSL